MNPYTAEAARCRVSARNSRVMSGVTSVLAAAFVVPAVLMFAAGVPLGWLWVVASVLMSVSAILSASAARHWVNAAESWDRAAGGNPAWN